MRKGDLDPDGVGQPFEAGVKDLAMASALWPGWLERLLTRKVDGLTNCLKAFELLGSSGAIKVFVEVASLD